MSSSGSELRLLYVIDSLAPHGAERSLAVLAKAYGERGVRADVAFLKHDVALRAALEAAGTTTYEVGGDAANAAARASRLVRLIRERRPDLVHTTLYRADLIGRVAAAAAGVPVVSSLVSDGYGAVHRADPSLVRWKVEAARLADLVTARAVRRFHALTHHVADVMSRRLTIPRDRIDVVPRGRDPVALGRRTPDRHWGVREAQGLRDQPLILAVARQEHTKGLDVLLRSIPAVVAAFPDARVVIAGRQGKQTPLLRTLTAELGVEGSVRFVGARDDVPDLLAAADVLAVPSRAEGFGGTLVEAMALETPIVASDLPAFREVVGEKCAVLVPPGDDRALARALAGSLLDRGGASARAAVARRRFLDRFTIDRIADEMVAFYVRAMGTPHVRGAA